jgi:hypothetical protein
MQSTLKHKVRITTDVIPTNITPIQFIAGPNLPNLKGAAGCSDRIFRPLVRRITIGIAYEILRKMVQLATYALNATLGPA